MSNLDGKRDKVTNVLGRVATVGASCLFIALLTVLIEWVTTTLQISWVMYLVSAAEIIVNIITTAVGVFLGLAFFSPVVYRYLEQGKAEEQPNGEAADQSPSGKGRTQGG